VPQRIGAFTGLGSLIYLYSHLSVLREERAFLQRAQEFVEEVEPLIEQDKQFDLIVGLQAVSCACSGCITSPHLSGPCRWPSAVESTFLLMPRSLQEGLAGIL